MGAAENFEPTPTQKTLGALTRSVAMAISALRFGQNPAMLGNGAWERSDVSEEIIV